MYPIKGYLQSIKGEEMAENLGRSQANVATLEKSTNFYSPTLEAAAKVLECSVEQLID